MQWMLLPYHAPCLSWVNYILKLVRSALTMNMFCFVFFCTSWRLAFLTNVSMLLIFPACFPTCLSEHRPSSLLPFVPKHCSSCFDFPSTEITYQPHHIWPVSCLWHTLSHAWKSDASLSSCDYIFLSFSYKVCNHFSCTSLSYSLHSRYLRKFCFPHFNFFPFSVLPFIHVQRLLQGWQFRDLTLPTCFSI